MTVELNPTTVTDTTVVSDVQDTVPTEDVTTAGGVNEAANVVVDYVESDPTVYMGHPIEEARDVNPELGEVFGDLSDKEWDTTCDIYAIIFAAIQKSEHLQSELAEFMDIAEIDSAVELKDLTFSMADDMRKSAKWHAIAQTTAGFVGVIGGSAGAYHAKEAPDFGRGLSTVGSSAGSTGTGIEAWADAYLQQRIKEAEGDQGMKQTIVKKNGDLKNDYCQNFAKTNGAYQTVMQQQEQAFTQPFRS